MHIVCIYIGVKKVMSKEHKGHFGDSVKLDLFHSVLTYWTVHSPWQVEPVRKGIVYCDVSLIGILISEITTRRFNFMCPLNSELNVSDCYQMVSLVFFFLLSIPIHPLDRRVRQFSSRHFVS